MKRVLIILIFLFDIVLVSGQEFDFSDLTVMDKDKIMVIPWKAREAFASLNLDNGYTYTVFFFKDFSTYELCISAPLDEYTSVSAFSAISWGDYKVSGNKMLFYDRVANFKMEAEVNRNEIRFPKDYFPGMNTDIWEMSKFKKDSHGFIAIFDSKKAEIYRKDYDNKYKELFQFTPGIYNGSLEIGENGKWKQKFGEIVLAEGKWYRERNILILNCPNLECNFYMTIGENRLGSMLLLMDLWGQYYYNRP